MNTKIDEFKTEIKSDNTTTSNSLDMKLSDLTSKKNLLLYMTNLFLIS